MSFDLDAFLPYRLSVLATEISRRFAATTEALPRGLGGSGKCDAEQ